MRVTTLEWPCRKRANKGSMGHVTVCLNSILFFFQDSTTNMNKDNMEHATTNNSSHKVIHSHDPAARHAH